MVYYIWSSDSCIIETLSYAAAGGNRKGMTTLAIGMANLDTAAMRGIKINEEKRITL